MAEFIIHSAQFGVPAVHQTDKKIGQNYRKLLVQYNLQIEWTLSILPFLTIFLNLFFF